MSRSAFRLDAVLAVWLVLIGGIALSWWLGADHGLGSGGAAAAAVLAIGFVKAWLIGRSFMELHHAPALLRRLFDGWVVIVGGATVGLSLAL